MPRILAETICSPDDLSRLLNISFGPLLCIGKPEGVARLMPGITAIPKNLRGIYTIWASCNDKKPLLLYGGKCVAESGIRHRISVHFLRSQNEGYSGIPHINGGSYLHYMFENLGLQAEYFVSIAPVDDAPRTHALEKALLFQIDFIANDAENSKRRGEDLVRLFKPMQSVPPESSDIVEKKPKKIKKVKKISDESKILLESELTDAKARIIELETRIAKLEEEKVLRKTLKSNLNMYEDAIKKLEPIYSGNLFLEESYINAVNLRNQTLAKLSEID